MRSATRDLLRSSLTAGAVAGMLFYAQFYASRDVAPADGAMARTDSIRYVKKPSGDPVVTRPKPAFAAPDDSAAAHSGKFRTLLALAR